MAVGVSSFSDDVKLLLARYQLCVNIEERRQIYDEIQALRREMLSRLKSRTESLNAQIAERMGAAENKLESQRELLVDLKERLLEATTIHDEALSLESEIEDNDALPEIELAVDEDNDLNTALFSERVQHRQDFYRRFLETEDPKHPSESRPNLHCPECEERGFIRVRRESAASKKGSLGNIIQFIPGRNHPMTAYCLNCTHTWKPKNA